MKQRTAVLAMMLLIAACGANSTVDAGPTGDGVDVEKAERTDVDGDSVVLMLVDDQSVAVDASRLTPVDQLRSCLAQSVPGYFFTPFAASETPTRLSDIPHWFEVDGTVLRFDDVDVRSFADVGFESVEGIVLGDGRAHLDLTTTATVIGGQQDDVARIEIPRTMVEPLAGDIAAGASLLVGTRPDGTGQVLSVRPDNTVSSLDCDSGYVVLNDPEIVEQLGFDNPAEMVRAFTVGGRVEVAEQIEAYLDTKEAEQDAARAEASLWVNQDPMRRSIDLTTPPDVLAALDPMSIELHVPDNWAGKAKLALCVRQTTGWGPCVPLNTTFENNTVTLPAYIDRTEAFELWFLDSDGRFESATKPFQTFEPSQLPEGTGWILSPIPGSPSADVVSGAETNTHTVFELTAHR